MKFLHLLPFFIFLFLVLNSQAQTFGFSDDFSDGNLNFAPEWKGDTAKFEVSSGELHLNDLTEASPASIHTESEIIENARWEFDLRLGFSPSGSNYSRVYIVADHPNPDSVKNGYFVQIGGQSGTVDDVSLYKIQNGQEMKLIDGTDGLAATDPELSIKIIRDSTKTFHLYIDTSQRGSSYLKEGRALDTSINRSSYFIVQCIYTSTRSDKFHYDDFFVSGEKFKDTIPPNLISVEVTSDSSLLLEFNEIIGSGSLEKQNFAVDHNIGNPAKLNFEAHDSSIIILQFNKTFSNGLSYQLEINSIEDVFSNNSSSQIASFIYFVPDTPVYREVVINEIYADETPSNGLPETEFIEIFNASNKLFDLSDWVLQDESGIMPLEEFIFRPGDYLILCSTGDSAEFSRFGKVMAGDFPTLTNGGENLVLKDSSGKIIDELEYSDNWYKNQEKSQGGYSLEQINPFTSCSGQKNFAASNDPFGGTPGKENSIFDDSPDLLPPGLINVNLISNDSLLLHFSEKLDPSSIQLSDFSLGSRNVASFYLVEPEREMIYLSLANPVDSGIFYELIIEDIEDCPDNVIDQLEAKIILPFEAQPQDFIINEILFNPRSGGYDFVEIYNRSERIIGLDKIRVANWENGSIAHLSAVAVNGRYLRPLEYYAFTENKENIINEYPRADPNAVHKVGNLPSFNDEDGTVFLVKDSNTVIDAFTYHEKMHFELLQSLDGVSLERVNPDISTNSGGNFQSASESEGFATPGYLNSQHFISIKNEGRISIDPELFSPDNDGYHDILQISYQFDAPNFVANISVFDKTGRLIRALQRNELLGKQGSFFWNGLTDENEKAKIGIYIIYFEAFRTDGKILSFKKTCVLAGKLE